jgi:putative flippase GtrA
VRPERLGAEAVRFVLVGGANTLVTAVLFLGLAQLVAAPLAYVAAYCTGIVLAGLVIPTVVFRQPASLGVSRRVALGYLVVLLLGAVLVWVLEHWLPSTAVVVVTLAVTVPANFVVARFLSNRRTR